MDTMAFVEDFLKSQGIDYTTNQEERSFEINYQGDLVNIPLLFYCPEINEENGVLFDEIISYAFLACNVPEEKASEIVAYLNQVNVEAGPTFSKIFLDENQIIACGHFFVWDEMNDEQLDLMLFSPVRFILDYEEDFLRILVGDEEKKEPLEKTSDELSSENIVTTALASAIPGYREAYVPLSTPLKDICRRSYIASREIIEIIMSHDWLYGTDDETDYSDIEDFEFGNNTISDAINYLFAVGQSHVDPEVAESTSFLELIPSFTELLLSGTSYYTRTSPIFWHKRKTTNRFASIVKEKYNISLPMKEVYQAKSIGDLMDLVELGITENKT